MRSLITWMRRSRLAPKTARAIASETEFKAVPDDFPTFPPPPPQDIIGDRDAYLHIVCRRKYACPQGIFEDAPLYALYRLYEYFLLDDVMKYRNLLESFCRHRDWAVCDIPDPKDELAERYAALACVTYFLVHAFNARIQMGLAREAPSLMTEEQILYYQDMPESEKKYESVPQWAVDAPALEKTLVIPTHDGVALEGKDDKRANKDCLSKNILIWTPHILFT